MLKENNLGFDVPVLFILFNRPKHAHLVLERLREVKPTRLFVSIDGPRAGVASDAKGVQECLSLLDGIDWQCDVVRLINNRNLGCKVAVSQAISWFFSQVEEGIILEDDCLPDYTFFEYCRTLLHQYSTDCRVMHIGGCNLYEGLKWGEESFFFTNIPHIWGWATWRRAWEKYDVNMRDYISFEQSGSLNDIVLNTGSRRFWRRSFKDVHTGKIDTWDYQWVFAIWLHKGFCITPNQNLVSNIGFDQDATHTTANSDMANIPTIPIDIEKMKFPDEVYLNHDATEYAMNKFFQLPSYLAVKISKIRRIISYILS
ncbi:hemolytic protein HlpA [Spirosoma humi]